MSKSAPKSKKRGSRRAPVDVSVLGEHPTPDFFPVMTCFRTHGEDMPSAMDEFFSTVGATPESLPNRADSDALLGCFVEWFTFERVLAGGQTPLAHYALCAPARTPEQRAEVELLRQAAASQFFSLFWVRAVDKAAGTLTLQDAVNGATCTVWEEKVAADLAGCEGSLVAARLMSLADEWRCPMGIVLRRDGMDEQGFSAMLADLTEKGGAIGFMDAVMLEYGSPDPLAPQTPASEQAPDGAQSAAQVVLDGPSSEVPGVDVAPEHRSAALMDAAKYYGLLARDFNLAPTWGQIVEAVRTCPIDRTARDVVADLFKADDHGLDHLDDGAFSELMDVFLMAWNLLPHDALGGKSVAESYHGA